MRDDGPVIIAAGRSAHTSTTLDWGLTEAEAHGADVVLVHVHETPVSSREYRGWYPVVDGDTRPEAAAYLEETLRRAREEHPRLHLTSRLLDGAVVPSLQALTREARLLVVGAHGRDRRAVGRVTTHLAAHAACPVAVVRAAVQDARLVVVGVDGSAASLTAATAAAREAELRSAPLVVLHARPFPVSPYDLLQTAGPLETGDPSDPTHQAARRVTAELRERHPDLDVHPELVDDDPVHALVNASQRALLLVVGARGVGSFTGMLLGSVSSAVVRGAASPVLVVHTADD